ncbi:hypothetical protein ACLB1R_00325 [Escherichia coli]
MPLDYDAEICEAPHLPAFSRHLPLCSGLMVEASVSRCWFSIVIIASLKALLKVLALKKTSEQVGCCFHSLEKRFESRSEHFTSHFVAIAWLNGC